ncbi:sugar phosphate isomerase/epimerase family protein [Limnovirga soli]|uniref:Sugar phosphate isomerase/epimerase n=1 Tax=Limnovirga soli TaxID=2656915 RepID=A0A8J8FJS8_9BACT|nr:sugar phosphate isomerase/epimerase [Limnovirga soli]NNV57629.1 sugar phosphate isomerase/epimerase [Limnovirga soli]
MKLLFFCPQWGYAHLPLDEFFARAKADGYDGVEMSIALDATSQDIQLLQDGLRKHNLLLIAQHWQTVAPDFDLHKNTFQQYMQHLALLKPLFINSQTGKDYFSVLQNMALINTAGEIATETGIPIVHETHRGKWSFAAHITQQYLMQYPHIRITLDISHWCNVAETFLHDQSAAVALAMQHTDHLHARVGHTQSAQVIDPRAPEQKEALDIHLHWWDTLINIKQKQGAEIFTITPEFGAPPYQALLPFTRQPIADQWEVNLFMKNLLKSRYAGL